MKKNKRPQVSAIVPVFNEEKRVGKVINTLLKSSLIDEVICINDGSSDKSLRVLKGFGKKIKLINFPKNQGKGKTVSAGIKEAQGEFLLFCDSDLINFTLDHIKKMLAPILSGKTRVVFAVPTKDKTGKYARHEIYLAGERIYPRDALLPHFSKLSRSRGAGGSEIYLNTLFSKKEIKIVPLVGLIKPLKTNKWSSTIALKQYLLSAVGILQESGRIEINSIRDLKQLENLIQVDTFEGLIAKIGEIRNKKIKALLKKYFLKYITKYVKKIID